MPFRSSYGRKGNNRRRPMRRRQNSRRYGASLARVTRIAMYNKKRLDIHRNWTDYTHGFNTTIPVNTWYTFPLLDPIQWDSVMRQSVNVRESPSTYVRNVRMSFTCTSPNSVEPIYWTVYLCHIRPAAVDWRPQTVSVDSLLGDVDYTLMGTGNMPQLNQNTFKIIATKTFTTWQLANSSGDGLGNPFTSQARRNINREVKTLLRTQPLQSGVQGSYWKNMTEEEIPCYQQMWLLVYPQISGVQEAVGTMDFSAMFTCVNSD